MKRRFFLLLLLVVAGGLLGLMVLRDPGYVLISWQQTSIEMGLWLGGLLWLLSLVAAVTVIDLLFKLLGFSDWWTRFMNGRRQRRSQQAFEEGITRLERGDWQRAERQLFNAARLSSHPLPAYLAAARAAAQGQMWERAEKYLVLAEERGNRLVVGLARARLLLVAGRWEQAAVLLAHLHDRHPGEDAVRRLRVEVLVRLQRWADLADVLPQLQKAGGDDSQFPQLEKRANREVLAWIGQTVGRADKAYTIRRLQAYWQALPTRLRGDEELQAAYAGELVRCGADDEAEALLAATLEKQWSNAGVEVYGRARSLRPDQALARAETWRDAHPSNPVLMLTLGRLCLQNRRWLDARAYFEAALALRKSPEAYAELIRLLSQMDDRAAQRYVVESLGHMSARLPDLPLP
ncbi:MAG: heme biosynthesis HemY N-terminal domain-containing protein [Moraxellaceae bacterium]|nr:heme biosynthesis HemY N-terminal domain-containing protein [Moraxellaceae bacterium]